jgi:hypothetical protein
MLWILFAAFSAIIVTISISIRKNLLKKNTVSQIMVFVYLGMMISSTFLLLMLKPNDLSGYDNKTIILAVVAGLLIPTVTYTVTKSFNLVSNMAYTGIVFAVVKTLLLLLVSIYIFQVPANKMTICGILLALVGVTIVVLYK